MMPPAAARRLSARLLLVSALPALLAPGVPLQAQTPAPAAPRVIVRNGGFETSTKRDELWDGVSQDGSLTLFRFSEAGLTERAAISQIAMPPSIRFADMNGDGKPDIVAATGYGFVFIYPNTGTPQAPQFGRAEVVPIFLGYTDEVTRRRRTVPRIALADMGRRNMFDLLAGNFIGELLILRNAGSGREPRFDQPRALTAAEVQIADVPGRIWGNLLAPDVGDFNKDGRLDIILGEGSYSANNIHVFFGTGATQNYGIDPKSRQYLAYGDGKEHLLPAVVDWNSDGFPDILVGDRSGALSLYLHPGASFKPGDEIKFSTSVSLGTAAKQAGMISPAVGDYNGDGKFDILFASPNGRISVSLNEGTPQQPKFATPTLIKGTDALPPVSVPSGWDISEANLGFERGNAYAAVTTVTDATEPGVAPPEGAAALKIFHYTPPNGIVKFPPGGIPNPSPDFARMGHYIRVNAPITVEYDGTYDVVFQAKGNQVRVANWSIEIPVTIEREAQVERTDRGARVTRRDLNERLQIENKINAATTWTRNSGSFRVSFKDSNINKALADFAKSDKPADKRRTILNATLSFVVDPGYTGGALYLDDVVVTKR